MNQRLERPLVDTEAVGGVIADQSFPAQPAAAVLIQGTIV